MTRLTTRWLSMSRTLLVAFCMMFGVIACADASDPTPEPSTAPPDPQVARSIDGVVVAAHPLAAQAGAQMLEVGGNAADAAVAAAFVLAVAEPTMSGLGGRVQILGRTHEGESFGIDGTTQAPLRYRWESAPQGDHGYVTVGIPGQVAGVLRLLDERGRLPRSVVLAPAIELATGGVPVLPGEAARLNSIRDAFAESVGGSQYFLRDDGRPWQAGDTLVQADLARTLEAIAVDGALGFYTGAVAEQIVADLETNNGFVTLKGLAEYRAEDGRIVTGSYRGYQLVGTDRPAGGATAIETLHILENFDAPTLPEADWASVLGQSLLLALEDRYTPVSPEEEEAAVITSKGWAAQRAREVRLSSPATVSVDVPGSQPVTHGHTSHLATADRDGMVVALTQSLGPVGGARVATPGLGFLYAATIGGSLGPMEPGQRASSAITPFLVLDGDRVAYVLGAAGGVRILSAVVEVASRLVDQGLALPEAVAAPRFFPGFSLRSEPVPWDFEFSVAALWDTAGYSALPFPVRRVEQHTSFGRVHAIAYDTTDHLWVGVADPRWEGAAVIPRSTSVVDAVAPGTSDP